MRIRMLSALRDYWSALLLVVAAAVLLIVGAPAKAALAGAGFALIGAAVTRAVDVAKERSAEAKQAKEAFHRDLDETRRLAYAVLSADRGEPMLVASLVNALAHHGMAADPERAAQYVEEALGYPKTDTEGRQWLKDQIDKITARLRS